MTSSEFITLSATEGLFFSHVCYFQFTSSILLSFTNCFCMYYTKDHWEISAPFLDSLGNDPCDEPPLASLYSFWECLKPRNHWLCQSQTAGKMLRTDTCLKSHPCRVWECKYKRALPPPRMKSQKTSEVLESRLDQGLNQMTSTSPIQPKLFHSLKKSRVCVWRGCHFLMYVLSVKLNGFITFIYHVVKQ